MTAGQGRELGSPRGLPDTWLRWAATFLAGSGEGPSPALTPRGGGLGTTRGMTVPAPLSRLAPARHSPRKQQPGPLRPPPQAGGGSVFCDVRLACGVSKQFLSC